MATKTFPTLYSKRSDGGVQSWTIEVEGNKFRAISGTEDGKKVTATWTTCAGKNVGRVNETSPEEQAEREAAALFQKKLDKGYKRDKADIDDKGFFHPMLAQNYNDKNESKRRIVRAAVSAVFPLVISQRKLNGMRCVARASGLFSRYGKPIVSSPHIMEALAPIFKAYPSMVIDGELYNHKYKNLLNRLMSILKKQKPTEEDLKASAEVVEYHIYDVQTEGLAKEKVPYVLRHSAMEKVLTRFPQDTLKLLSYDIAENQEELDKLQRQYVEEGYEGQIIRLPGPYENKRSKYLIKRKDFIDEEFTVVDVLEGKGNRSGMAGKIVIQVGNQTPEAGLRGNEEFFRELLENKADYIGKSVTVRFFEYTEYGVPYLPVAVAFGREDAEGSED